MIVSFIEDTRAKRSSEIFRLLLNETLDEYWETGLYTLTLHWLNNVDENLERFNSVYVLEGPLLKGLIYV